MTTIDELENAMLSLPKNEALKVDVFGNKFMIMPLELFDKLKLTAHAKTKTIK